MTSNTGKFLLDTKLLSEQKLLTECYRILCSAGDLCIKKDVLLK